MKKVGRTQGGPKGRDGMERKRIRMENEKWRGGSNTDGTYQSTWP